MSFGERVKEARKRAQLSQEALARLADMSAAGVAKIEQGGVVDPHYSTLHRLAEVLSVNPLWLVTGEQAEESVLSGKAEAPEAGPSENTRQRTVEPGDPAIIKDTPEKKKAREAIGTRMEEAGEPVRYLAMPQEELQLLFDELEAVEDAKALAEAVRSERAAFGEMFPVETFPRADFPGHPIQAIMGTSATAMMGIRRVAKREAEREAARIHAEAEAVVKSLEMAPSGH